MEQNKSLKMSDFGDTVYFLTAITALVYHKSHYASAQSLSTQRGEAFHRKTDR